MGDLAVMREGIQSGSRCRKGQYNWLCKDWFVDGLQPVRRHDVDRKEVRTRKAEL